MSITRVYRAVAALMLAVVLAACGGGGGGSASDKQTKPAGDTGSATAIAIKDPASYDPAQTTVKVGTTVTWTNEGQLPHSVTAKDGSFDSKVLKAGESFTFTFGTAGTFEYMCSVHGAVQSGKVTVTG